MIKHKLRKLESEAEVEQLGNIGDEVGDQGFQEDAIDMMDTEQREFQSDASFEERQSSPEDDLTPILPASLVSYRSGFITCNFFANVNYSIL